MDIRNFFGKKKDGAPPPSSSKKKPAASSSVTKSKDNSATKRDSPAIAKSKNAEATPVAKTKSKPSNMEEKRLALLADSSDDESVGAEAAVDNKKSTKKAIDLDDDESVDEKPSSRKKPVSSPRKAAVPTRTSPRKRTAAAAAEHKIEEKKKRKIHDSSDDDDRDADYADDAMEQDDFEADDEEFVETKPQPKQTKKRPSSPPKKIQKKSKVEECPPKYHPPSSLLPTLLPNHEITLQPPIKLPTRGTSLTESFNIDTMTPLCLSGLTFVFSGILTKNTQKSTSTNAAIAIASPSKGEYYQNRNAYTTTLAGTPAGGMEDELPRDIASDLVKMLGGRVTGSVSGKTSYLVLGSILEDGREVEEGSKYRKVLELYDVWSDKYDKSKAAKGKAAKGSDPNSLVEIVRGVDEFWGLISFYSEWKRGTLTEEERRVLDEENGVVEKKKEGVQQPVASASAAAVNGASTPSVKNPYAQKKPVNPYAKTTPVNPYNKSKTSPVNPYAKTSPNNPYAKKTTSTTPTSATASNGQTAPSKTIHINPLWADKYAPTNPKEILGNGDAVTKLTSWLRSWENTFNDPKRRPKSLSGPNGPWKAALLSGPPGIGKTTTATLVARELNRDVIELNASDARSKKALTEALGDLSGTHALNLNGTKSQRKRCLIMDEVDGMGAGDRSGISELIQMIKKSKVPIICICNDRSSQKIRSLVQYCMDLRYRRPTKSVIAKRAVQVGQLEGMTVEINAAEALSESCGNDVRQVLNCLQMWSSKKKDGVSSSLTFRELRERKNDINKDEVLRVSMFDACKLLVEGSRGLANADSKTATASLLKRSDAYFVDYMLMGLNVHQNYLKVALNQFNQAKIKGDDETELEALNELHKATLAMSDFGVCEEKLRGADQNWSLLPLCSILVVKVGHHAGGPNGGFLSGYPEFAGWLGKNSSRNKKIRLLQELRHHMNYKVSADTPELRMNYLPVMRQQFQELLFDRDGAKVTEAIELMDTYGLDRDDLFENLDEFVLGSGEKKFGDLDSKAKAAFTREYNKMAHKSEALVAEQGIKSGRKKSASSSEVEETGELDVVDDDKAVQEDDEDDEEDVEALREMFMKKKKKAASSAGKAKGGGGKAKKKK